MLDLVEIPVKNKQLCHSANWQH